MANLYYREDLPETAFAVGEVLEVAGEEARHAVRVSRLRRGETTLVGNGRGVIGEGRAIAVDRDRFAVRLDTVRHDEPSGPELVLVQALAKGDRAERAVEQATEFGVSRIVPWLADRSVSRWDGADKRDRGAAKWRRIAREASKQSLRAWVPVVDDLLDTDELIESARRECVLALDPGGTEALTAWASRTLGASAPPRVTLVVGPEGGLSGGELEALAAAGARIVRLGSTVLRTSSAGPAGLAVVNAALGRW